MNIIPPKRGGVTTEMPVGGLSWSSGAGTPNAVSAVFVSTVTVPIAMSWSTK